MFVLKRGDSYVRYLGGRLIESEHYIDTGWFIVLGAIWTKNLQEAQIFEPKNISFNNNIDIFLRNVRWSYGMDVEIVKVKLVECHE